MSTVGPGWIGVYQWDIGSQFDEARYHPDAIKEIGRIMTDILKPRKLISKGKKKQQKYLVLLSNDRAIIDTEFKAMKKARWALLRAPHLRIVEMIPTGARVIAQENTLTKILESLEKPKHDKEAQEFR